MDAVRKRMRTERRKLLLERISRDIDVVGRGVGATKHVGSDAYPFYISSVELQPNGRLVVGMYEADSHFENSWTEGTMKVDKFDKDRKAEFWLTVWRNAWYRCDCKGKLLEPHKKDWYSFGSACSYQDPSF